MLYEFYSGIWFYISIDTDIKDSGIIYHITGYNSKTRNNFDFYMLCAESTATAYIYPVKCPYNNYTCYDLVKDYIYMYSWILTENTTLINFLQLLINGDNSVYIHYATDIIQVLSNQNQIYNSLRRC